MISVAWKSAEEGLCCCGGPPLGATAGARGRCGAVPLADFAWGSISVFWNSVFGNSVFWYSM